MNQDFMHRAAQRVVEALKLNAYPENLAEIQRLVKQWIDFDALFSHELKILAQRGCREFMLEDLERQRNHVISTAIEKGLSSYQRLGQKAYFPFLPVTPFSQLSIPTQMMMVHFWKGPGGYGENEGRTFLPPENFKDVGYPPKGFYWIYNVQTPESPMAGGVQKIEEEFAERHVRGLYLAELIALCIQDGVNSVSPLHEPRHALKARVVSGLPFDCFVPGIQLDPWQEPRLRGYSDRQPLRPPFCDM